MRAHCHCKNLSIDWHIRDFSLIARACQCNYCLSNSAHWISKSRSRFDLIIRHNEQYQTVRQGTKKAIFHQCLNCKDVIASTIETGGINYGAINLNCISEIDRFPKPRKISFQAKQSGPERLVSWKLNWCYPVQIIRPKPKLKLIR